MGTEKTSWISLMIVPEDGAGMRSWRISTQRFRLLKIGIWVVGICLLLGFVSFLAAVFLTFKVHEYSVTNTELIEAASKIEIIAARLADYEDKERTMRQILGGNLDLPSPLEVREVDGEHEVVEVDQPGVLPELREAIARGEERLRRIPTIWPVDVWQITKEFVSTGSMRTDHLGVDLLAYERSPVIATASGRVTFAGQTEDLGQKIEIDHENGWVTVYGHNRSLMVTYGDEVVKGQTIAIFGGEDESGSGPHLHYAIYYNKKPVDPLNCIDPTIKMDIAKKNN